MKKITKYKLSYFSINHTYKFKQENFAQYEELTESFNIINSSLGFAINEKLDCRLAINNLLNENIPHTSRVRGVAGGVPNPGRYFSLDLNMNFKKNTLMSFFYEAKHQFLVSVLIQLNI